MLDDYNLFITQFVILIAMLDPPSHLSLFLGLTNNLSAAERKRAACFSVVIAFGILTAFALIGPFLLRAMGISLLSFQIAGGTIIFLYALKMVLEEPAPAGVEAETTESGMTIAIYPLAVPIIAGPGSMLTMLLLVDNNRYTVFQQGLTILALAAVLTVLGTVFLMGEHLRKVLGANGTNVIRRLMGLLLAALAVNMVLSALALWLKLPSI
ncbi:MarC family transcriptional regulator [Bosea sp. Root381]|uniref:MarC family protein n=1 Tax=Bosea sp. Root381 TaxID=1736524 RepID=UPI000700521F|nr:MarC family protein [Bosea sp. Root381]KRE08022.1 MarC family transcriptional regulator [Bosea sp. Root381]